MINMFIDIIESPRLVALNLKVFVVWVLSKSSPDPLRLTLSASHPLRHVYSGLNTHGVAAQSHMLQRVAVCAAPPILYATRMQKRREKEKTRGAPSSSPFSLLYSFAAVQPTRDLECFLS